MHTASNAVVQLVLVTPPSGYIHKALALSRQKGSTRLQH